MLMNKTSWRLISFYVMYHITNCFYQNYFTVYLNQQGHGEAAIGMIMALAPLASLLGQPVWGNIGDRLKYKNTLLRILLLCAAAVFALLTFVRSAWMTGVLVCLFAFFYMSIQPMGDTITFESLDRENLPFGPVRMSATISFAFMSLIAGTFMLDHLNWLTLIVPLCLAATALMILTMPKVRGHRTKQDAGMLSLLKYKPLVWMLLFSALMMIGMSFFYNFYSIYFTRELGGSSEALGFAYFISAMSEIPFLIYGDRIFKRFGVGVMLLVSAAMMAIRWFVVASLQTPAAALWAQLLHCGCFLMMTFAASKYINAVAPDSLKAAGQLLYTLFTLGISRIAGSFIGGQIAQAFGMRTLFVCGGVLTVGAIIVFGIYIIKNFEVLRRGSAGEEKIG